MLISEKSKNIDKPIRQSKAKRFVICDVGPLICEIQGARPVLPCHKSGTGQTTNFIRKIHFSFCHCVCLYALFSRSSWTV